MQALPESVFKRRTKTAAERLVISYHVIDLQPKREFVNTQGRALAACRGAALAKR